MRSTYVVEFDEAIGPFGHVPLNFHKIHVAHVIELATGYHSRRRAGLAVLRCSLNGLGWTSTFQSVAVASINVERVFGGRLQIGPEEGGMLTNGLVYYRLEWTKRPRMSILGAFLRRPAGGLSYMRRPSLISIGQRRQAVCPEPRLMMY